MTDRQSNNKSTEDGRSNDLTTDTIFIILLPLMILGTTVLVVEEMLSDLSNKLNAFISSLFTSDASD